MAVSFRSVVPRRQLLEGRKTRMDAILNRRLVFTGWAFMPSVQEQGTECLMLQFTDGDDTRVVFTGSRCLIADLKAYEAKCGKTAFEATIIKQGKALVFA